MKPNTRPRRGLGVAVFLIGCVFAVALVVLGFARIGGRVDDLAELPLSGGPIPSDVRGPVTIFARVEGSPTAIPSPNVRAAVVDTDGNGLELKTYTSTSTFQLRGKSGIAEWSVTIPEDGDFALVGESADENVIGWLVGEPPVSAGGLVGPILGGILVGFLGFVFGLLIFFGAMFKRKIQPGAPGYVPQPVPGQYQQQPGQYQQPGPGPYQQPGQGQYPQQPQQQPPTAQPPTQLPPPPPPPPYPTEG